MSVNDLKLNEGDAITAASINDRFTRFAGSGQGVNQLATDDIDRKALGPYHTAGLVAVNELPGLSPGLTVEVATSTIANMTSAVYPNWTPVTDGSTPASITWTSTAGIPGGSTVVTGFLAMFNIEIQYVYESANRPTDQRPDAAFGARLAVRDSGGSWSGLDRTVRFLSHAHIDQKESAGSGTQDIYWRSYHDLSIKSFISAADGTPLSGIRAEMTYNEIKLSVVNTPYAAFLRYNLSIMPLLGAL